MWWRHGRDRVEVGSQLATCVILYFVVVAWECSASTSVCRSVNYILDSLPQQCSTSLHPPNQTPSTRQIGSRFVRLKADTVNRVDSYFNRRLTCALHWKPSIQRRNSFLASQLSDHGPSEQCDAVSDSQHANPQPGDCIHASSNAGERWLRQ